VMFGFCHEGLGLDERDAKICACLAFSIEKKRAREIPRAVNAGVIDTEETASLDFVRGNMAFSSLDLGTRLHNNGIVLSNLFNLVGLQCMLQSLLGSTARALNESI
jgi:hypothetical protein